MKVNELIKELMQVKNQEAEVKLIAGIKLYPIEAVWINSLPVIIDGGQNE